MPTHLDIAEQTAWFTGYRIEEKANGCRVNNKLNAAWTYSLPSGCSYPVLLSSVVWMQPSSLFNPTVKLKGGEPSLIFLAQYTCDDAVEDAYSVKMVSMTNDWYPDCWAAFLCMERPAGDDEVSPVFTAVFLCVCRRLTVLGPVEPVNPSAYLFFRLNQEVSNFLLTTPCSTCISPRN